MTETWSNGPGAVYAPHAHPYRKTLTCLEGSITFTVHEGAASREVRMKAGDVLDLAPGAVHSAVVGPKGATCSEVHASA